ncbi:PRD domain-containing protein [Lactobacillus sp. ESL0684]|uniref:PRD domain-containing protein n=1 Tax=Lactobacillus sp. ESL0684 TaxID=2983213 RepID=UPI0023F88710|nr:PRD domain-containing protein [Lactobacillus sp. ESL0684]WEV43605.1 PRD domain-containing protein [Lactobacillus sp. ESL0684]
MDEKLPKELQFYVEKSDYKFELKKVEKYVLKIIAKYKLKPTQLQLKVLGNHLSEMVIRAKRGKKLDDVDEAIFSEVSEKALSISLKIVDFINSNVGKLSKSESYVLSIHFENMLLN